MHHKARIYVIPVLMISAVLSFIILGCSNNNETDFVSNAALPASNPTTTLSTLTWDAPTTYTNSYVLVETDIKEYRVYYSTSPGSYSTGNFYSISDPNNALTPTRVTVSNIISQATGTYFFVVTAVDKDGAESAFSNEVSKNIQ